MILLEPEIVRQIARGKRQMVRVRCVDHKKRPKPGACKVRGAKSDLSCAITITGVEQSIFEDEFVWTIRFTRGVDEDRYPAARVGGAGGDYTSIPSRKLAGTGAEVSAHELSRFALDGRERHQARMKLGLDEWREATAKLRKMAPTAQQRKRLDSIAHQIAAIERENGVSSPQPAPPMPTRIAHGRP